MRGPELNTVFEVWATFLCTEVAIVLQHWFCKQLFKDIKKDQNWEQAHSGPIAQIIKAEECPM